MSKTLLLGLRFSSNSSSSIGATGFNLSTGLDYGCCRSCHLVLRDPFIRCHDCSVQSDQIYVCLSCFSKGREFPGHGNDHSYSVVKTDFSLLDADWSAEEEIQLMNALLTQGHGNWDELAKSVPLKTAEQCQIHFDKFYIENGSGLLDNTWRENCDYGVPVSQPIAHVTNAQQKFLEGVPRPGQNNQTVAGYNAARADFDSEFDNLAEHDICTLDHRQLSGAESDIFADVKEDDDEGLFGALAMQALQIYNNRLKRRQTRKRLVREFGLLNKSKAVSLQNRYPMICNRGGKARYDQIFRLGRLMCSLDFDFLLEGLDHELELRQKIVHLQEYRINGLTHLFSVAFFTKLRSQREQNMRELSALSETVSDWRSNPATVNYICDKKTGHLIPTTVGRRSAAPLDIVGLPGFEKLTDDEKELCSESRVHPETYLEIKDVLVSECARSNGLRLADARPLVKIDVNKTRKLFDFLIKKDLIFLPKVQNDVKMEI